MAKYYKKIERTFAPCEIIFTEDSDCDGMYIIESGLVRVYKTIQTPTGEKTLELVKLGPRSLFGEMALLDNKKRSASVQAIEETKCTIITQKMFEDQLQDLPSWVMNLVRVLVARLRETNDKLREKAQVFKDDTGGLLYIDDQATAYVKELKRKLEGTIDKAEKKLKGITDSIEDMRNQELKNISDVAAEGIKGLKAQNDLNNNNSIPVENVAKELKDLNEIAEDSIKEITDMVSKLDKKIKKS